MTEAPLQPRRASFLPRGAGRRVIEQHVLDVDVLATARASRARTHAMNTRTASAIDASKASGRIQGRSRKRVHRPPIDEARHQRSHLGADLQHQLRVLPGAVDEDARLAAVPALDHRRQAVAQQQDVVKDRDRRRPRRSATALTALSGADVSCPVELLAEALAGPLSGADARRGGLEQPAEIEAVRGVRVIFADDRFDVLVAPCAPRVGSSS